MAQASFYKLKEKKQKKIIDAIHNCLHNESYDKLSIVDIADEADISRASFYEYFIDKKDAVKTMVVVLIERYQNRFKELLLINDRKLFETIKSCYKELREFFLNNQSINFNLNLKFLGEFLIEMSNNDIYIDETKKFLDWIKENSVEGKTYLDTNEKIVLLYKFVIVIFVFSSIENTVDNKIKKVDIENEFYYQLKIVENGLKSFNDIKI